MRRAKGGKRVAKADLPTKVCPVCQRPFTWRKKWARDWERVVYCSKRWVYLHLFHAAKRVTRNG
ncbi:MAG: DUF2256 domain-containing protein [Bacteroidetes bacterium]|nr:DUF2256 domain-containing protein [Bacteroidota bacterium]